jgi:hypothetical protein
MSQVLCVHCQHPIEDGAPRRGNLVTCPSCKGQVYVPQVQHVTTFQERQAAARAASNSKNGPSTYKSAGKRASAVNSNGLSVAFILLAILIVGGSGLGVGGYFVYKAIRGHEDARVEMATSVYDFEKQKQPLIAPPPQPSAGTAAGVTPLNNSPSGDKPTREDLEKLQKAFQGYVETFNRLEQDYKKELLNTGLNRLLVADRITNDQEFKESRQIIIAAREVINKHRKIAGEEDEAFLRRLDDLRLVGVPTKVMVERIRGVLGAVQPHVDKYWGMDISIAGHYEQAINHLESTRGAWKLEGEALVFNENKDAERYKTFFDEVDKCAQMQLELGHKISAESIPRYITAFGLN